MPKDMADKEPAATGNNSIPPAYLDDVEPCIQIMGAPESMCKGDADAAALPS